MAKVVIIGAGLTGISTAYHLEKNGFFDYILFEKEETSGGLCRSVKQDGFTFDFTGHLLHASDPYFRELLTSLIGLDNLNVINRRSFVYSQDTYTRYPYQINLFGLPQETIIECIEGFATKSLYKKKPHSFYDWVLHTFGQGIAQHFFFPFQQKIFDYDLHKISPTWMSRFVPATSLKQMLEGAFKDNDTATIGYNANFFYPKYDGIQSWINVLKNQLKNPIKNGYSVKKIDLANKNLIFSNGWHETFQTLISTIPLDVFIENLKDKPSTAFKNAQQYLVCNSVINFNLGVTRPDLSDKHWIYFPEKKYPFYRIGFSHNFASSMAPEGNSALYGEFSYVKKNNHDIASMLKESLAITKKLFSLSEHEIATEKIISIPHAYVLYTFWREKNIEKLLQRLQEEHVYSIGRYGAWKYSSMQEAVLDGKAMAEKLITSPALSVKKFSHKEQ